MNGPAPKENYYLRPRYFTVIAITIIVIIIIAKVTIIIIVVVGRAVIAIANIIIVKEWDDEATIVITITGTIIVAAIIEINGCVVAITTMKFDLTAMISAKPAIATIKAALTIRRKFWYFTSLDLILALKAKSNVW